MSKETDFINIISREITKIPGNGEYKGWDVEQKGLNGRRCQELSSNQCEDLKADNNSSEQQCQSVKVSYNKPKKNKKPENKVPTNLIFHGIQRVNGIFQPTAVHYFANINGEEILLMDEKANCPLGTNSNKGVKPYTPDGKITPGEFLEIGGVIYALREWPGTGLNNSSVYMEFKNEINPTPLYDGLLFFRDQDKNNRWVLADTHLCSPIAVKKGQEPRQKCVPMEKSLHEKGLKLEKLLNEIERQYSLDLAEAAKDIAKPIIPKIKKLVNSSPNSALKKETKLPTT